MGCSGDCSNCGGCSGCSYANDLLLTKGEIDMLQTLAQVPFLPVARRADDMVPVYLEDNRYDRETYSLILQCMEKKYLIDIDYRSPLKGVDYSAYTGLPVHGSIALMARGQAVLELLETQGFESE